MKIILASKSPRRRELLSLITKDFTAVSSDVEEIVDLSLSPRERVEKISLSKAKAVTGVALDDVIISADTAVFLGDEQFGKPENALDARRMLQALSGKTHSVITAYTVICFGKIVTESVETKVTFREIGADEIEEYIASGEPFDKAGGYGIQGAAAKFCREIKGDYYNVVGLPVCSLYETLAAAGIVV